MIVTSTLIMRPKIDWHGLYARGFSIFPVQPRGKEPAQPWKRFQTERAPLTEIGAWAETDYNVGIVTGAISGLIVLDCDNDAAIADAETLGLGDALSVQTGRGKHFYFDHPGGKVRNRTNLRPGMDLRGDGGFVVGPGSIHPNGSIYSELAFWL